MRRKCNQQEEKMLSGIMEEQNGVGDPLKCLKDWFQQHYENFEKRNCSLMHRNKTLAYDDGCNYILNVDPHP